MTKNLSTVLNTLKQNDVLLNENKCIFAQTSMQFFGHHLNGEGIRPLDSKIDAIKSFRKPSTIVEVHSFVSLVTYVGKFIPKLFRPD